MKKSLVILFLLPFAICVYAQHPKKAIKAYEAAEKAFTNRDYDKASLQIAKALSADPNYAEAWMLQGELGMETRNYDIAILGYEKALAQDSMLFPPAAITLARLYDARGAYKREIPLLQWYQKKASGNPANDATVSEMLVLASFRDWALSHPVSFDPQNLGNNVNTSDDEYVNMLRFDGSQLLFTRKTKMPGNDLQKEYLLISQNDGERWNVPETLSLQGGPDDIDYGAAFISADGRKLYMTGCGWSRENNGCDLYVSEWQQDSQWSTPLRLGNVNSSSWESQPCVSGDGKELYFVSRRSGNADIYRCLRNADGSWSAPENLGNTINTSGTEMAPFLHPDGHTLYFSSDKHIGMGGFDLFMSRRGNDGVWQEPLNLGFPVNTNGDEINFFVAADGKTAFVSSQRDGGYGGYDIYTFELAEEFRSDSANYLQTIDLVELTPGDAVILQNIQFEFNSAALTADSESGIQILTTFLKRNPELKVELAGHTDNVGNDNYNLKLSFDRAEAVKKALIANGIEESRLTAKGYGASKPLTPNDTEDHRSLNRRTEMIIID